MEPTDVTFEASDGTEINVTLCQDRRTVIIDDGNEEVELHPKDGNGFEWDEENFKVVVESRRRGILRLERLQRNATEETLASLSEEEWARYRSAVAGGSR